MIENYLLEIADRGWHVYTASQACTPRPDHWTVTLRQITDLPVSAISYGQGRTLADALAMAVDGIDGAAIMDKPAYIIHSDTDKPAPIDLSRLLQGIGPSLSRRP